MHNLALPLRMGLQTRILLLVIGGLTIIFAVFSYLGLQTLNESTQRSLGERLVVAKLIAAHTDRHLQEALALLGNAADPALFDLSRRDVDSGRAELGKLFLRSAFFSYAVFVVDVRGQVVWSEPYLRLPPGTVLPGYSSLREGLLAGQPGVSDLLMHPQTGVPLVMLAVPVVDRNGEIVGAVGSATDLSQGNLSLPLEPVTLGRTGYAEIVDQRGRVLYSTRADRLFQKDDHADRFYALIHDQQPVVGGCHRCHQAASGPRQNDVLAFAPLRGAPWGVALRQLEGEVLAPTQEMAKRIVLVTLPLFAAVLTAAWITTSRVVGPIRALTAASQRIADGDLDFVVKPFGKDELGALAAAFDAMRERLKASYAEIAAWNRDLEQRVEQRTRDNTLLYEEVQRKEQLRGQLLEKVIVAQEEERRRIARELHDETGQSLTALAISLASAHDSLPLEANGAKEALGRAKSLADKLLAEIRRLISDLRPTVLDDLGLVPALRRYATTNAELLHLDIQLHVEGRRRRLSPPAETALFRIVQEAITNVAKHAQATSVTIRLAFDDGRATVVVQDDGRGFDVAQTLSAGGPRRAVGLLGMRERATLLGGTLEIKSQPGAGTTLVAALPLEREEVRAHA